MVASFEDTVATMSASRASNDPQTIVVTGTNSGTGLMACKLLYASNPQSTLIIVARTMEKAEKAIEDIRSVETLEGEKKVEGGALIPMACDQSSLKSVEDFSSKLRDYLKKESKTIDALCLNAGMLAGGKEPIYTEDDMETTFQVNYASMYLLVVRLHDMMNQESGRIIITASSGHEERKGRKPSYGDFKGMIDSETGKAKKHFTHMTGGDYNAFSAYEESKLATVSWTMELNRRLEKLGSKVIANCFCVGFVTKTNIFKNQNYYFFGIVHLVASYIMRTSDTLEWAGGELAWLVLADEAGKSGGKYYKCPYGTSLKGGKFGVEYKPHPISNEAADEDNQTKLWKYTAEILDVDVDFLQSS